MGEIGASPIRVAVLGANGQVGTELCLCLKIMGFCEPIPVTRSVHSTALLSRAGISCRTGDLADPRTAAALLSDCDLILDLALPIGRNLPETKAMVRRRIKSILSVARPSKGFVLASTTVVYRSSPQMPFFRFYRSMKLFSEQLTRALGARQGVPIYVFRLGQVHGELQSCTDLVRRGILRSAGTVCVPDQPSDVIFVASIAEAMRLALLGRVVPRTYTMISQPAWSFAEVARWHAERLGVSIKVDVEGVEFRSPMMQAVSSLWGWLGRGALEMADHYKELVSAMVCTMSVEWDQKLRFYRSKKTAASAIHAYFANLPYRPFDPQIPPPGTRFPFVTDSRTTVETYEERLRNLIQNLGQVPSEACNAPTPYDSPV